MSDKVIGKVFVPVLIISIMWYGAIIGLAIQKRKIDHWYAAHPITIEVAKKESLPVLYDALPNCPPNAQCSVRGVIGSNNIIIVTIEMQKWSKPKKSWQPTAAKPCEADDEVVLYWDFDRASCVKFPSGMIPPKPAWDAQMEMWKCPWGWRPSDDEPVLDSSEKPDACITGPAPWLTELRNRKAAEKWK